MTLGTGEYTASITGRGGNGQTGRFEKITAVRWGRTIDSPSTCEIRVAVEDCCGLLADVRSWGHELHLHRDGVECWAGPVIRPAVGKVTATILARDVSAWVARRAVRDTFATSRRDGARLAGLALRTCFADDDPGVLRYVQVIPGAARTTVTMAARAGYWSDVLDELARSVIDWTTAGRRIILMPDGHDLGLIGKLDGADFLADLTVVEDGDQLTVRAYATAEGVQAGRYGADPDPFYGLVETIVEVDGTPGHEDLVRIARTTRTVGYPAPMTVEVPSGAALTPAAPVAISDLIPGVTVDVTAGGCRPLTRRLRLLAVDVDAGPGQETVKVTLGPFGVL